MLEMDNIFDIELSFGVVVDPASWHVWYLELVTWTSSLKHHYDDQTLGAVSNLGTEGELTWIVDGIDCGSWGRCLPVHHTYIVHLVG